MASVHALDHVLRDPVGAVEHVRDGADGDAGAFGDVADRDRHRTPFAYLCRMLVTIADDLTPAAQPLYCNEMSESFQRRDKQEEP